MLRPACLCVTLILLSGCALPTLDQRPAWTRSDRLPPGVAAKYPGDRFLWRGPNATGADRLLSKQLSAAVHRRYGIVPGTFGGSPYTQALRRQISLEAAPIDELAYSWSDVHHWRYKGTHGETALVWSVLERSGPLAYYTKRARAVSDELEDVLTKLSITSLAPFEKERRWVQGIERLFHLDVLRAFCVELGAEARDPMFRRLSAPIARDFAARLRALLKTLKPHEDDRRRMLTAAIEQYSSEARGRRTFDGAPKAPTAPRYKVPARQPTELDARLDRIEAACGPKVRAQAAIILRPDPVGPLIDPKGMAERDPTAASRDRRERAEALRALGALGSPKALALLTEILEQETLAAGALAGLQALGPKALEAAPPIVDLLPNAALRPAAISALREIGGDHATAALKAIAATTLTAIASVDSKVRLVAIAEIGRLGEVGREAIPALAERLGGADEAEGLASARALAGLGTAGHAKLREALKDPKPAVRARAAIACTDSASLNAALKDPEPSVRSAAAEALGRLGADSADAVPDLIVALGDPKIRTSVIRALGAIGPAAAQAAPQLMAEVVRGGPKGAATAVTVSTLAKLTPTLKPPRRERLLNLLLPLLKGPEGTRIAAIDGLVALAPQSVPELLKAANRRSEPEVRAGALIALGRVAVRLDRDQLQAVVPLLLEAKPGPARAAAGAGLSQVVVRLEPELFVDDRARRQLALRLLLQIGPLSYRALPSLRVLLNDDPDPKFRAQAAAVLSAIGLEAGPAGDDLENAAKRDPDAGVKAAAKSAFERVDRAVKAFEKKSR